VVFTALAIVLEVDFNLPMHVDWGYASLSVERIWNNMENWVMVALPMFVFMGLLLDRSGIAGDLMRGVSRLLASVRGGLALTVILIGLLLAATTGIVGASVVLLALLGLPAMMAQGYDRPLAAGTVAAVGTLGILIPPSIMLVLMADRMAMSVGDLFLGAVMPGLLLGALYIGYVVVYGIVRPEGAPAGPSGPIDRAAIVDVARAVIPPTGLILLVLGSIFFGLATPTEAAGVGAAGALALAWSRKQLGGRVMPEVLRETTITTGFIFGVMLGATAFALVLRGLGGDKLIEEALLALPFEPDGIVLSILFATFLLGFFLDWIELTLIILPLVAPVVTGLGYDPVWFTVLFAVCLQTSFLTPPVGFALFFLKGVAPPEITVRTIYKGVAPFILLQLLAMVMIFFWPQIVTWLPEQAYG
jgi:tripartite ATP-independent transporter DctM subunit